VNREEPTNPQSVFDRLSAEAKVEELLPSDDGVLLLRKSPSAP